LWKKITTQASSSLYLQAIGKENKDFKYYFYLKYIKYAVRLLLSCKKPVFFEVQKVKKLYAL